MTGSVLFIRASQTGRLDTAVVLSSLYPAITVLLARIFLREHFTRWKALGMLAALIADSDDRLAVGMNTMPFA